MLSFHTFFQTVESAIVNKKRLFQAFNYAKTQHNGQTRKGSGDPYFIHPIRVAKTLADFDEEIIIAGLLHDVVEDTNASLKDIEERFGPLVSKYVDGLTKRANETWQITLQRIAQTNPEVIYIKIADRIDNLSDNFEKVGDKTKHKYKRDQAIFDQMINEYQLKGNLVDQLRAIHERKFGSLSS